MTEIEQINEAEVERLLREGGPMLLLFSDGSGTRGEFLTQFRNSSSECDDIMFAQCNPFDNPSAASRFSIGNKPVLLGIHAGEAITRSARPWASDVKMAVGAVREAERTAHPEAAATTAADASASDTPLAVTDDSFQHDVLDSELPVLVDFWAEWCGPCRMVAPILDQLAREFAGRLRIAKVDVDANQGLAQQFQVTSIPTMMAFAGGQLLFNQAGALPEATLRQICGQLVEFAAQRMAPQGAPPAR